MNLFKKITTFVFIVLAFLTFAYIVQLVFVKIQDNKPPYFLGSDSRSYINYYITRQDYQFHKDNKSFTLTKNSRNAVFKKDSNVDLFLRDWTLHDQKLYPNNECKYIRISIPSDQKNLEGNILFACVNTINEDTFNNLTAFN